MSDEVAAVPPAAEPAVETPEETAEGTAAEETAVETAVDAPGTEQPDEQLAEAPEAPEAEAMPGA
jgi:hypothetical protein